MKIPQHNKKLHQTLELIASENFVSQDVLEAMGSVMTNKYAEGYPGKRYYGGCEFVDVVEQVAIERLTKLFGAKYANVQPHSGAQANFVFFSHFNKIYVKLSSLVSRELFLHEKLFS
ncbi:hypothetical protein ACXM0N_12945 [Peribacillus simplex]